MKKFQLFNFGIINLIAYAIYFGYVLYWTLIISRQLDWGDSVNFFAHQNVNFDYYLSRYSYWSSRVIVETLLVPLSKWTNVFLLFNAVIMLLLPLAIRRLFERDEWIAKSLWLIIGLIMLYPFREMNSAGWIATVVNYYYPLFFGLLSLQLVTAESGEISGWRYLWLNICLLFACNIEQGCLILLPVFLYQMIYSGRYRFFSLPVLIACLSLLFILITPGNQVRMEREIITWLPDFINYSRNYQLYMGFQVAVNRYFFEGSYVFSLLLVLLLLNLYYLRKPKLILIPVLLLLVVSISGIQPVFIHRAFIDFSSVIGHGLFVLSLFFFFNLLLALYECFEVRQQAFQALGILILGFSARFALGLSPTIFASDKRTYIFTDFALILVSLLLLSNLYRLVQQREGSVVRALFELLPLQKYIRV